MSNVPQERLELSRPKSLVPKTNAATVTPSGCFVCSPAWTRTTNYCLEGSSYIPLTTGPKYLRRESNPYGRFCPQDFKSCVSTSSTTKV